VSFDRQRSSSSQSGIIGVVFLPTRSNKVSLRFRLPSWRVMGRLCTLIFNVSVKSSGTVGLALSSPRSPPSRQDGIPRPAHHNHSPQCNSIRGQSRQQAGRRQHDRAADLSHQEALAGRAAHSPSTVLRATILRRPAWEEYSPRASSHSSLPTRRRRRRRLMGTTMLCCSWIPFVAASENGFMLNCDGETTTLDVHRS